MDRDTSTILAIPALHPGFTSSGKRMLFASTVLAAVITVIAKSLTFVGIDHGGQGCMARPFSLVHVSSMQYPWPRPLALAREAS